MKKVYLMISSFALGSLAFGQINKSFMNEAYGNYTKSSEANVEKEKASFKAKVGGDTLWKEDFASGIGNWTKAGTHASTWIYDLSGPGGYYTDQAINNASHSQNTTKSKYIITSPTSANGFIDFVADEFGTANNYPILSASIGSPAIDLSSVSGAVLNFYTRYRYCCSNTAKLTVEVSTDDFATKQSFNVEVNGVAVNVDSGSKLYSINLAPYLFGASNKSNFKFRFAWAGHDSYFWQVDDIAIIESNDVDIELTKFWLNDLNYAYENTDIPNNFEDSVTVQGVIKNNGFLKIPANTEVKLSIFNGTTGALVKDTVGGVLTADALNNQMSADTITFVTKIKYKDLPIGRYFVRMDLNTAAVDKVPTNDSLRRTFYVTNGYLGQENYNMPHAITSVGKDPSTDISEYMTVGNIMTIPTDMDLHGLEVTIGKNSYFPITAGTEVEVKVYKLDWSPSATNRYVDLGISKTFTIQSADIPSADNTQARLLLNFHKSTLAPGEVQLLGGNDYLIGIYHAGGTGNHFAYVVNQSDDDYNSRIYVANASNVDTWYWAGKQICTRMCFDQTLGLENAKNENVTFANLYPNPTTGATTVNYSLKNSSDISVEVLDVTGKVVYSVAKDTKVAGQHSVNIDATAFKTGIYYVTLSSNEGKVTQKLIKN